MALPAILAAIGRVGSGAKRLFGGVSQLNPNAGRAGLPVATPAQSPLSKLSEGLGNAGQMAYGLQALTSGLGSLGKAIIQLPLLPFKLFSKAMETLGTVAAAPMTLFSKALDTIQGPALAVIGALGKMRDSMTAFGRSMAEFVQLASPAHVEKFKLASDDLTASIGKILIPAMEFATKLTRGFADVIFTLSDPLQRLVAAFFKPLEAYLNAIMTIAAPFIQVLGAMINILAELQEKWGGFVTGILKRLGLDGPSGLKDSTGAAVRNVGIGSVEDYGRKAQIAAFRLGSGADPADRTASGVEQLVKMFQEWVDKFPERLGKFVTDLGAIILKVIPGGEAVGGIVAAGERRAEGIARRIDRAHSAAVDTIEDTLGIELPSFR